MNNIIDRTAISGKFSQAVTLSIRMKGIYFMMGLWLICAGIFVSQPAWCLDPVQRQALVASLPQGEKFENDGFAYVWLPTLRAEKTGAGKDMAATKAIEQKGLFSVFKKSQAAAPAIRADNESATMTYLSQAGFCNLTYPKLLDAARSLLGHYAAQANLKSSQPWRAA